jgi:hypothetical protein
MVPPSRLMVMLLVFPVGWSFIFVNATVSAAAGGSVLCLLQQEAPTQLIAILSFS